jgi:hypothetical protein
MSDGHPPACTGRRVPTLREALTVWHHDPSRPPWGIVQRAPKQAMMRALAPVADTAWTSPGGSGARAPPVPPGNRPRRFTTPSRPGRPMAGSGRHSIPPSGPDSTFSPRLEPDGPGFTPGTREELDVEETRSPITQHRADNSRRIGDPPLGRKQASDDERLPRHGGRLGH